MLGLGCGGGSGAFGHGPRRRRWRRRCWCWWCWSGGAKIRVEQRAHRRWWWSYRLNLDAVILGHNIWSVVPIWISKRRTIWFCVSSPRQCAYVNSHTHSWEEEVSGGGGRSIGHPLRVDKETMLDAMQQQRSTRTRDTFLFGVIFGIKPMSLRVALLACILVCILVYIVCFCV